MSRAPFSRPNADRIVSGSHIFIKCSSLNHWLRGKLPKARVKHLFGVVAVVLFLFGSQLTACGNAAPPRGSASPTSNTTSLPNTPTATSKPLTVLLVNKLKLTLTVPLSIHHTSMLHMVILVVQRQQVQ